MAGDKTDRAEATRYVQLANSVPAWFIAPPEAGSNLSTPLQVVFSSAETESSEEV